MVGSDIDDVVALVVEFVDTRAHHPAGVSPVTLAQYLSRHVGTENLIGYVARDDAGKAVGVIFGIIGPDWLSGKTVAQEQIWYVQPDGGASGLGLLRVFVAEARRRGAALVISGYIPNFMGARIARVLERSGFNPVEHWWVKDLTKGTD